MPPLNRLNDNASVNVLKEIRDLQLTQIRAFPPYDADIVAPHLRRNKVYTCVKSYLSTAINVSGTIDQAGSIAFVINSVGDVGSLATIFDQYRIAHVSVDFIPLLATLSTSPLYTVIDYDDSNVLTSLAATLEYSTLQISQQGQQQTRVLSPRVALSAYTGAFTGFANQGGQWIDAASPTVQHYGIKWYFPSLAGASTVPAYNVVVHLTINLRANH